VPRETAFAIIGLLKSPEAPGRPPGRTGTARRDPKVIAFLLSRVPLFAGMSKRQLRRVAEASSEARYRQGAMIVEEGAPGETFYAIVEGEARVHRGRRVMNRLGAGDFFGEISLIDGGPRTATVTAETPVVAVRLSRRAFDQVLRAEPGLSAKVLEELATRVRRADRPLTG
jgi:CRP/FNR family cyclic AMP-dependent transcriptional regulator